MVALSKGSNFPYQLFFSRTDVRKDIYTVRDISLNLQKMKQLVSKVYVYQYEYDRYLKRK